jgi:hypothetical protein
MPKLDRPTAITKRIVDAIETETDSGMHILEGLRRATALYLADFCSDCRKRIAKHLRRMVEQTVADADAIAARDGEVERHVH